MSVRITAVRFAGYPKAHEAVSAYQWKRIEHGQLGSNDKLSTVAFVTEGGGAWVSDGTRWIEVRVVRSHQGQPYLRTSADGVASDNLLALPTY